jgi:hypothetical protein
MTATDFMQVAQKMWWANHQATTLQQALAEYVNREPYVTFIEDKPELHGYQVITRLHEAPPPKLSLLAGDFFNSAHGALDYLAWQLTIREGKKPGASSNFPIELPNEDGTHPSVQITDSRGKLAISDPEVLQALDAVQPYQDGVSAPQNPLYVLKVLNRETKHRHLPLLAVAIMGGTVAGGYVAMPEKLPSPSDMRLKDEEEIAFYPYQSPPESSYAREDQTPSQRNGRTSRPLRGDPGRDCDRDPQQAGR